MSEMKFRDDILRHIFENDHFLVRTDEEGWRGDALQ